MADTRWSRLRELFDRVRELPSGERDAVLERELATESELRRELDALLRAHDEASGFLADRPAPAAGTVVGAYTLIEPIGEGGFAVVYLAEQVVPMRRRVALKLIKPGMDSKQVIARFEAERQALALMDHPGIAQVFEAGETNARPSSRWSTCRARRSRRSRTPNSCRCASGSRCSCRRVTRSSTPTRRA